ncbi:MULTISPECIES: DUF881 domain-containing protein [Streptomyces]|uniref:DUF881 domain-containing protein n=1 Tax=Streptomyces TaxID=1883 RepID=UPI0021D0CBED|nr:DUF881 domain-containing protein [Streptomyces sp. G-5]MCU4749567.1 DUF881 domain-containing protein [Streptomyces sp. G-5]
MCAMSSQPNGPRPPARPDASMSLLTTVMNHTLDEGYAQAAARRHSEGRSGLPRTLRAKLWLATGLVLAGLVVTLGAAQAREAAPTVARERQELLERVESGTEAMDALQQEVDALRTEVAARQRDLLSDSGGDPGELTALLAGADAVQGPGLELVINDAKGVAEGGGDAREGSGFDTGRVRDRDLQRVVNGLWTSGAEAIAVNGQRLTALSAIRAAGDAILVDNRPMVPPYTVQAIGDPQDLRTRFDSTVDGQYLNVLRDNYGIRAATSDQQEIRIPAATSLTVRTARPADTGEGNTQ